MANRISRRDFLRYAAVGAAGAALSACATTTKEAEPTAKAEEPTEAAKPAGLEATLNIWSYSMTENDQELVFNPWLEDFHSEFPGIQTEFDVQGATSDTIESYVLKGVAWELDDVIPPDVWAQWTEATLAAGTYQKKKYMAPVTTQVMGFQHNGKMMQELGYDAEWGPETWDELLDVADKAKGKDYYVDFISTFEWLHWLHTLRAAGGTVYSEDGMKTNMREQPAIDALNLWVTLFENDYVSKEGAVATAEEATGFANYFNEMKQLTRNRANCKWYAENMPEINIQLSPGRRKDKSYKPVYGSTETRAWIITQGSKNKDASVEFVKYTARPEEIGLFCNLTNGYPTSDAGAEHWEPDPCQLEWREKVLADTWTNQDCYHFWQESKVICAPHFQAAVLGVNTVEEALDGLATELEALIKEWSEEYGI
jgi:ABC-type glycerol-3-phosphate transport system substrate-binding protein